MEEALEVVEVAEEAEEEAAEEAASVEGLVASCIRPVDG